MRSVAVRARPKPANAASPQALGEAFSRLFKLQIAEAAELILVRHAEPDYRAAGNGKDPWDPPLTERGRWQAMRVAIRLRRMHVDAVYTSTMRRALETAAFIAAAKDLPMVHMHQLREINLEPGALESADSDASKLTGEVVVRLPNNPTWDVLPGFEPSHQFRRRVISAVEGILAERHDQRVVVVTHGGVINAYLSKILDIPRDLFFLPDHASMSVVRRWGDLSAVQGLNDIAHLLPTFEPR
jgi:broad specificity phosphatase PhoE